MKRLIEIQNELKAPKNQRNNFGGYNYRSCEDILEAVKPLLKKHGLALIIKDDLIAIDGRFYIKAIAQLFDETGKELTCTTALAREEESKKGMDASQLTGSTSSYARKYALNGLFAIDDTKDSDATNTHGKENKKDERIPGVPTDEENSEIDIFEGLKATSDKKRAFAYFQENVNNVKDKTGFRKTYQEHIKRFGGENE